jgi:hypothetical protein
MSAADALLATPSRCAYSFISNVVPTTLTSTGSLISRVGHAFERMGNHPPLQYISTPILLTGMTVYGGVRTVQAVKQIRVESSSKNRTWRPGYKRPVAQIQVKVISGRDHGSPLWNLVVGTSMLGLGVLGWIGLCLNTTDQILAIPDHISAWFRGSS